MEKPYYVYEHWLDGQCFYVGKGSYIHNRAQALGDSVRNKEWRNFVGNRKKEVIINIVKDFYSEQDAYDYEEKLSIKRIKEGYPLQCKKIGNKMTDDLKNRFIGENNPMFSKNAFENKTEEEMKTISKSKSEKMKGKFTGENNPMFGKKHSEEFCKWQSDRTRGGNNPRAKKVKVILNNEEIYFDCLKDASKKYGTFIHKLIKTGEAYKPKYMNKKHLEGMKAQYLE